MSGIAHDAWCPYGAPNNGRMHRCTGDVPRSSAVSKLRMLMWRSSRGGDTHASDNFSEGEVPVEVQSTREMLLEKVIFSSTNNSQGTYVDFLAKLYHKSVYKVMGHLAGQRRTRYDRPGATQ